MDRCPTCNRLPAGLAPRWAFHCECLQNTLRAKVAGARPHPVPRMTTGELVATCATLCQGEAGLASQLYHDCLVELESRADEGGRCTDTDYRALPLPTECCDVCGGAVDCHDEQGTPLCAACALTAEYDEDAGCDAGFACSAAHSAFERCPRCGGQQYTGGNGLPLLSGSDTERYCSACCNELERARKTPGRHVTLGDLTTSSMIVVQGQVWEVWDLHTEQRANFGAAPTGRSSSTVEDADLPPTQDWVTVEVESFPDADDPDYRVTQRIEGWATETVTVLG